MRNPTRIVLVGLVGLAVALVPILFTAWSAAVEENSKPQPADPFRIAGNFYYVGTNAEGAFLITGPEGHVLLDGDDRTAPVVIASIAKLGFDIKDVKVLINSGANGRTLLQQ